MLGADARSDKHRRQFTEVDDAHKTHRNFISGFAVGMKRNSCGRKLSFPFSGGFPHIGQATHEPIFSNLFLSSRTLKTKASQKWFLTRNRKFISLNENDRKQFNWTRSFDGRERSFSGYLSCVSFFNSTAIFELKSHLPLLLFVLFLPSISLFVFKIEFQKWETLRWIYKLWEGGKPY